MTKPNKFACGFCKKAFTSEKTLGAHMCVKKRRHHDKDDVASRMGLELYRRYYELNTATKNAKTSEEFINSQFYAAFIKFARRLMDLQPVDQARFVDYVFRNAIKDRDWCKDKVYEAYIIDLLAKEPATRGLERSIETMEAWGEKYNVPFNQFFAQVAPSEATHLITMGKISPWVYYLAPNGNLLENRLSDEQSEIIDAVINPKIWFTRFSLKQDDCTFIRDILQEAHI